MNSAGYDFAIPDNHEFDFGMDRFLALAPQLTCGYYSCNFIGKRTNEPILKTHKIDLQRSTNSSQSPSARRPLTS